jgi:excinuclease ABC subunit A
VRPPPRAGSGRHPRRTGRVVDDRGRAQDDAIFVFDEPTVGLHPLDVRVLLQVLQRLLDNGATVLVIEHDLDVILGADHIIDLGPGGCTSGGCIVGTGTPEQLAATPDSVTGRYLGPALHELPTH